MRNPRILYTLDTTNTSGALGYVQVLVPTISGNLTGVAALGSAGAQTGIVATLPPDSAALVSGNTYFIDVQGASEAVVVTITAGPTLQADGSSTYTLSFTTTKAHPTQGPIAIMGGMTLGTTAPKQSYGAAAGVPLPRLFGDLGNGYPLGFAIAATTGPANATAPSSAFVVDLGYA